MDIGLGADAERDRDPGQSLYVTPCVGGWIISTADFLKPVPDAEFLSEDKAILDKERRAVIADMRAEGFSDEFVALFTYACENRVAHIRFHRDVADLPGFPIFDW